LYDCHCLAKGIQTDCSENLRFFILFFFLRKQEWNTDPFALFGPTVEYPDELKRSEKEERTFGRVFMSDTPYNLLCRGDFRKVPWILGVCKDEGLTFHAASKFLVS